LAIYTIMIRPERKGKAGSKGVRARLSGLGNTTHLDSPQKSH